MPATPGPGAAPKDDPRTVFGWCMYDWANSAYVTTVAVGLLPRYFAEAVVPAGGVQALGTTFAADTLWAMVVGTATLIAFLTAPVLGAIADFSAARKRFLLAFAWTGSLFAILLYFCRSGDVLRTLLFFLLAQVGFIGANVFYDAFLPHIASDAEMDRVSGRGYAYGYVGGGLQFALSLGLVQGHAALGLALDQAVRLAIVMAAVWWAGFTLVTARLLVEPRTATPLPEEFRRWPRPLAYVALGVRRTLRTTRQVRRYRQLALFLAAFMLYDDGIQTIINMATVYATVELRLPASVLMLTLLVIQAIATVGAFLFTRLSRWIGTKPAIMISLVLWTGIVVYAGFLRSAAQFVALGAVVGLVMGGSQALSRSLFGSMIPSAESAEFYGFYTVFSKFAAMWGPWVFAIVKQTTGSSRLAILSLVVQFLGGLLLLARVDIGKARAARAS
ncbi:MAG TPA: MFS transporter [Candidatus Cryosericum sp.]|nr:MFS transporter [Candidatus Cryosericum sp.]